MKSAYELAMERLEKASGPSQKLNDEQKAKIAEIEKIYDAKIAETKLSYEARLRAVETQEQLEQVQTDLSETLVALERKRDKEKESVWSS